MKINYSKTCTLPHDLIPLLKNRGLSIPDEKRAVSYFTNIGYFRLNAYFHPLLKEPKDKRIFKTGSTFDMMLDMYRFDRKLRILFFNEIEKIEVAIRSAMSNWISHELGDVFWMTTPKHFKNPAFYEKRLEIIQNELDKSDEDFIIHFRDNYTNPYPPAWMIAEIIPFGVLCKTFKDLKYKSIRKKIADYFALPLPVFTSWTISLVSLRNLCGHHNRTWNKEVPINSHTLYIPEYPWINQDATDTRRVYFRICIIKYLLFTVSPNNRFTQKLLSLLAEFPTIDTRAMGFPPNWRTEPIWCK
jgi:abortive infection bacteriophage resistance protein